MTDETKQEIEAALICDDGSLCFGYSRHGNEFYINED
jgi:hypothetical protein